MDMNELKEFIRTDIRADIDEIKQKEPTFATNQRIDQIEIAIQKQVGVTEVVIDEVNLKIEKSNEEIN